MLQVFENLSNWFHIKYWNISSISTLWQSSQFLYSWQHWCFYSSFLQFTKNHYISSRQVKSKLSNNEKSINHLIARPVFDEFILFSWNLTFYCWIRVLKVMALLISFVTLSGLELAREQVSTFFQNYWMLKEYIS